MTEVLIDGVRFVPEAHEASEGSAFMRGVYHACLMLSRYTHRTNCDLLDESALDLQNIVTRESR